MFTEQEYEAAAQHFGISVAEVKRRVRMELEIKAARASGQEWMIPMIQACDSGFIQDIVRDNQAPTGPSAQGVIPSSQQMSNVRSTNAVGDGTGWQHLRKLGPPGP